VVTQPDRPAGRGLQLKPCPVKKRALELGLSVISPEKLKDSISCIKNLNADLGLAVAYGKIFREPALEAFKLGIMNIHLSLLPAYRGAAPVQQALFNGEKQSGVSIFWIDKGLDTGPLAAQSTVPILEEDNALTLFGKLTAAGALTLSTVLKDIESGKITKTPQQGEYSLAPMIEKKDTVVSFRDMTARKINNLVRGLASGMPAYAKAQTPCADTVQLLKTAIKPCPAQKKAAAGAVVYIERGRGFFVQCLQDVLFIETVRPAGKSSMSAWDYINGKNPAEGEVIFS
jgi:methionyl-tRNA formyltransferase